MDPRNISIADYTYALPAELIAHYPLAERDASKLLIYKEGNISEDIYRHIVEYLPSGSLLVFNNTKVVEARILFRKPTGGQIELFCLEPPAEYGGIAAAMAQTGKVRWKCLIGGASKWKAGQVLRKAASYKLQATSGELRDTGGETPAASGELRAVSEEIVLEARYVGKQDDAFLIEFSWQPADLSFSELLHRAGLIPLPPYIRRAPESTDAERYQTIYAQHDGSVAAPTAGLHFTEHVFETLAAKDIRQTFVTLHVGAGTFLPVKAPTLSDHTMHVEWIAVTKETIRVLLENLHHPTIPVGTTSARTVESLYWLGVKTIRHPALSPENLVVEQWDAYDPSAPETDAKTALTALLEWMREHQLSQLITRTQLLITPGYRWRIAGGLITNFHQPESTLLLLVASLIGEDWRKVYDYALGHDFRFLSYGDGCLLLPLGINPPSTENPA
ncbi:S-adenosylmethionine:tRNA ribosyltransferase-isomerase [Flavitalea sp. BT771]|uniref:S-adenosylmethionine:tRNA ribosyltransferase-isomerase n=1 Tax=Flavitalea sp. BT771 TaxID=3063329 RepID=UPI0026E316C8|nr:S-adenosylmethionine:tRNA ribosyltransferase-isomerase [Flavitalea sp. BT771]MDO6435496.1 S-adenosylmethionine:tRNA ribosyltransferase-isomerase [Flavitalea sp. BT771]MDV6224396.1 S-adenosylmethionine:tRNA ribosyltransferase-isomerase [Flavitalea sp. BT771]